MTFILSRNEVVAKGIYNVLPNGNLKDKGFIYWQTYFHRDSQTADESATVHRKSMTGKNLQVGVGARRLWGFTLVHRSVGGRKTDSMSNSFVEGVAYYSTPTSGAANISKKMTRHHNSGILGPVESGEYTSFLLVLIALGDTVSFGNGSYSLEPNSS